MSKDAKGMQLPVRTSPYIPFTMTIEYTHTHILVYHVVFNVKFTIRDKTYTMSVQSACCRHRCPWERAFEN